MTDLYVCLHLLSFISIGKCLFEWIKDKPWLNIISKKGKKSNGRPVEVCKLFHLPKSPLFPATVSDSLSVKARPEGHSLRPSADPKEHSV